ncbi:MAG: DNA primase small subunit PriS [Candidatus Caldarchaeum sp.]|nr:DNA primase small subunit PriS [Candidatus Caldarchaeum sp.]
MSFRKPTDAQLVQHFFRKYYEKEYADVFVPSDFDKREFGYTPFGQKIMVRHLSFKSFEDLHKTLVKEAPLHVYRSAAIYRYPQAPMEEKGWIGGELIFDIDADHLNTGCKPAHDYLLCSSCRRKLVEKSSKCPDCGGDVIEVRMICDMCLGHTKMEMAKLIDFIETDFGLDDLTLSFSGNRGYHLSVSSKEVLELGRAERQEIVDYVMANHIDLRMHGLFGGTDAFLPGYDDPGWRGRLARETKKILDSLSDRRSSVYERLEKSLGAKTLEKLEAINSYWAARPRWDLLATGRSGKQLISLTAVAVENSISHIDTVVTTDIHRLIRLADTLNGKTGLKAVVIKPEELEDFNPLNEAVVIPEQPTIKLRVIHSPQFILGGNVFGPYENEAVKLPAYAGVYLMCKGLGTLAND